MSRARVAEETSAAFVAECDAIRALMARATSDEVATRYQVGARVQRVKCDAVRYGDHAVDRLANELRIGVTTLYRYAMVAENWTPAELGALMARTNRIGEPLSWSHLVTLTRATSAGARREFAERCLVRGWSVRELTQQILGLPSDELEHEIGEGDPVRVALHDGIQNAGRAAMQVELFLEAFEARLADTATDDALVARAIRSFEHLQQKVEASLGRLRQTESSSGRVRVAPRSRTATLVEDDADEPMRDETRRERDNEPRKARVRRV
jgi:hypothetical protein